MTVDAPPRPAPALRRSLGRWCGDEPVALADGRTSSQVQGANSNEVHLVRVEVVGLAERRGGSTAGARRRSTATGSTPPSGSC